MITSIAFTVYPVTNMVRSRRFYEEVLGLLPASNFQDQWVEYEIGSGTFAITTTDMGHLPGAIGAVIGFEVDEFDRFLEMLKQQTTHFVTEAFETAVCPMAVIADPDGNHVTIHKRKG